MVRELVKSENSIELAQLASRIDSAMYDEISNDDDPFAKVKGLISDMIVRLEEKASADAAHSTFEAFRDRNDAPHDHVTAQASVPDDLDDFPRIMQLA